MNPSPLGRLIRDFRESTGINQKNMAAQMGCSAAYLCAVESNKKPASKNLILKLCEIMGFAQHSDGHIRLMEAAILSEGVITIDISSYPKEKSAAALAFALTLPDMDSSDLDKVMEILAIKA